MRGIGVAGVVAIGLCATCAGAQEKAPAMKAESRAVMGRVIERYRAMPSLRYEARGQFGFALGDQAIRAAVESTVMLARDSRFSIKTAITPTGLRKFRGTVKCDGKTIWEYDPVANVYTVTSLDQAFSGPAGADWLFQRAGFDVPISLFLGRVDGGLLKALGGVKADGAALPAPQHVNGSPVYNAEIPPPVDMGMLRMVCRVTVDADTMLVTRCALEAMETGKPDGGRRAPVHAIMSNSFSEIHVGGTLADGSFTFTPPPGAKKVAHLEALYDRVMAPLMEQLNKQIVEPASPGIGPGGR